MKIYCAGPIRGDKRFQQSYEAVVDAVSSIGHTAFSELNKNLLLESLGGDREIFLRDLNWLEQSERMIAEVSAPSLGVGFEIAYALYVKKIPVLCLKHKEAGKISAMISGCNSNLLQIEEYSAVNEIHSIIETHLQPN